MKRKIRIPIFIVAVVILSACTSKNQINQIQVSSPDKKNTVEFSIDKGKAYYSIITEGSILIGKSALGLKFQNCADLDNDLKIESTELSEFSETWEQPWGETHFVENQYQQLVVHLVERKALHRKLDLTFRVFNNGVGFRYSIPEQPNVDSLIIADELTEFNLPAIYIAWWIPACYKENSFYESLYRHTPVNKMDTIHTPVTLETPNGHFLSIHEANLTDYAAMTLFCKDSSTLKCDLVPWPNGVKVYSKAPLVSPWRTVRIGKNAGDLITNYIDLNLNEPCAINDVSWIKPCKYVGIWWGMHLEKYTWSQGPNHGATTANVMKYIDFAADNGFDGVLVEGWNTGWDSIWVDNGKVFSFTQAYPDFDLEKICKYAASKKVELIGHHETAGAAQHYENQIDEAFKLYKANGVNAVKTGYVGKYLDGIYWHDGQYGVRHYRKVVETAAAYKIMIDNHEPIKPTGLQRTYPNLMTGEGARGQEYNAWADDGGNPPEHTTILPFTRLLAGPMDYTPGIFNFTNKARPGTRVRSTITNQLALYVVLYSPQQMAADLPENYTQPKPFEFIKQVPVDWQKTVVLNAQIGDYITIARKDRNSDDWFFGSITDENSRDFTLSLSFLEEGVNYIAKIYADGDNASWDTNPTDFKYAEKKVTAADSLSIHLATGGGQAIHFVRQQ